MVTCAYCEREVKKGLSIDGMYFCDHWCAGYYQRKREIEKKRDRKIRKKENVQKWRRNAEQSGKVKKKNQATHIWYVEKDDKSSCKVIHPIQKRETRKTDTPGWIYFLGSKKTLETKIGLTINLDQRIKSIRHVKGDKTIYLKFAFRTDNMKREENDLHSYFSLKRTDGEWFYLTNDDLIGIHEGCLESGRTIIYGYIPCIVDPKEPFAESESCRESLKIRNY